MQAVRIHSAVTLLGDSAEKPKVKRKLTTVLCADARGYTGQMQADETGTLERLRRYRTIMAESFTRHDGRMVNTWGDSVIAEFASVVEAVRCAVEIQDEICAANADLSPDKQMQFRIGINLGDVMLDGGDIYGEGVNEAARLEALAQPGGIMVSEAVRALTQKQLKLTYEHVSSRQLKGGECPVSGYQVRLSRNAGETGLADPRSAWQPQSYASGYGKLVARDKDLAAPLRLYAGLIALIFAATLLVELVRSQS